MPLSPNTEIVTAEDVAAITQEKQLENWDTGGSSANFDNARKEATNFLIRWARGRGVDPAKISNTDDLKAAAAYWTVWRMYSGHQDQGDELVLRKIEQYQTSLEDELGMVVLRTTQEGAKTLARRRFPVVLHRDAEPRMSNPVDNRRETPPDPLFEQKL